MEQLHPVNRRREQVRSILTKTISTQDWVVQEEAVWVQVEQVEVEQVEQVDQ